MEVEFYNKQGEKSDLEFSANFMLRPGQPRMQEMRRRFDLPFVTAEAVQLSTQDIDVLYADIRMKEFQTAYFDSSAEPEHIEMHFTLAGEGTLNNQADGRKYSFSSNQQNIHYAPYFIGNSQYDAGAYHKIFEVRLSKKFFLSLAEDSSPVLMEFANRVAGNTAVSINLQNLPISFAMHQCIHEIMHMQVEDGLKKMFLQSKCIELLSLQAQAYEQSCGKGMHTCKTRYDRDRIYFARDYLVNHAACPPSLTELARIAGLNEFKLKKGFRELFNTSVFGYLSDFRLNEARNGLLSGAVPIKEMAAQLGYSSVQHFTRAFKKKFGVPPGRVAG